MPTAFVTGASRGIGKSIAIYLAESGYDIAATARTVENGQVMERSQKANESNVSIQPGSLSSTAEAIEAEGVRSRKFVPIIPGT
jgi:NAD(P)-dependent dehydrogenase (short-subunit alcohol dehydrogenase family)